MLEHLISEIVPFIIHLLELIGIIIISVGGITTFYKYIMDKFKPSNHKLKLEFAKTLAFALEFKLASEILKTVITKDIKELYILGIIIILRAILTFVIHYEIKFDTEYEN